MQVDSFSSRTFKTIRDDNAFLGLWASGFFYFAALGFVLPFLPLLLQTSGLTYAEIGIVYMIGLIFPVFLQTIWGAVADRIGRKTIIMSATTASAIISGLYPHASSFLQFSLLGLLWYTFLAAATTVTPALAMDIAGTTTVGRRFGTYRISGSIGWITSTATSGFVAESLGIKTVFYLATILYLASAVFVQISARNQPPRKNEASTDRNFHQLIRNKNFAIFLATIFMANISAVTFLSFLSLYTSKLGGSDVVIGWAFSIAAIAEVPCMIYLAGLSDKIGRKPLLVTALFSYPLRLFLYTIVITPNLILPIQLLYGLTFGLFYVTSVALVSDVTSENRGIALGLYSTASSAGSAAGSALAGFIADSYGLINMYRFMTAFSLMPALLFMFTAKETLRNR